LITGGLGPTRDDKTIDAISKLTNRHTSIDDATITRTSERKGIPKGELPPHYKRMARTISGAKAYLNPVGVSPTTVLEMERTTIVAMPGPPREVQAIFEAYISSMMAAESKHRSHSRRILVDMVESEVEPLINQVMSEVAEIYMKPLISQYSNGLLPVEIVAFGKNEESCKVIIEQAIRLLRRLASMKGRRVEEE
jgi:nicotinamide-nucleotide amidase